MRLGSGGTDSVERTGGGGSASLAIGDSGRWMSSADAHTDGGGGTGVWSLPAGVAQADGAGGFGRTTVGIDIAGGGVLGSAPNDVGGFKAVIGPGGTRPDIWRIGNVGGSVSASASDGLGAATYSSDVG